MVVAIFVFCFYVLNAKIRNSFERTATYAIFFDAWARVTDIFLNFAALASAGHELILKTIL